VAEALLRGCPRLSLLATSRELLNAAGEVVWRVPSLALPDLGRPATVAEVSVSEAVRLFTERARQAQPAFAVSPHNAEALARICARLDGIPLAIELAAARVRGMTVEQIAARLDDCFRLLTGGRRTALQRQQTLRATIDWSHDLLTEAERVLLRRLSVFAGGWTLEAAEAVCGSWGLGARIPPHSPAPSPTSGEGEGAVPDLAGSPLPSVGEGSGVRGSPQPLDVLDLLTRLIDRSLVVLEGARETARYRLLETVRQYAGERLAEAGEADTVRDQHADYYLAFAEAAEPHLYGRDMLPWLDRLEAELDNFRAALHWWSERGEIERALRLGAALFWPWHQRDHAAEGLAWLRTLLARPGTSGSLARARALYGAGFWLWQQGDHDAAQVMFEEMLGIAVERADHSWQGRANLFLAFLALDRRDPVQARAGFTASLAQFRRLGDEYHVAHTLTPLGLLIDREGDPATARRLLDEALALARGLGNSWLLDFVLHRRGHVLARAGELAAARADYEEALAHGRARRQRKGVFETLHDLGHLMLRTGDLAAARAHLAESLALRREVGTRRHLADGLVGLAWVAQAEGRFDEAHQLYRESAALWEELGQRDGLGRVLVGCASLAAARGQARRALRLTGAAEAMRQAVPWLRGMNDGSLLYWAPLERALALARAALAPGDAAAAWAEGQAMTLEAALADALAEEPDQPA
jgi:non-specific serine/threonine protein kinase